MELPEGTPKRRFDDTPSRSRSNEKRSKGGDSSPEDISDEPFMFANSINTRPSGIPSNQYYLMPPPLLPSSMEFGRRPKTQQSNLGLSSGVSMRSTSGYISLGPLSAEGTSGRSSTFGGPSARPSTFGGPSARPVTSSYVSLGPLSAEGTSTGLSLRSSNFTGIPTGSSTIGPLSFGGPSARPSTSRYVPIESSTLSGTSAGPTTFSGPSARPTTLIGTSASLFGSPASFGTSARQSSRKDTVDDVKVMKENLDKVKEKMERFEESYKRGQDRLEQVVKEYSDVVDPLIEIMQLVNSGYLDGIGNEIE
ncbi:hypothetical protein NHQ30_009455 [Ciborinia camelliae]|nr:hypothetical protein NHQ30_009455 [Ciborinia camelliae]